MDRHPASEPPRYHLRRKDRAVEDPAEIDRILTTTKYVTLALCGADMRPYAVVLSHGYDAARGCLYFHSAREGRKIDLLRQNPHVSAVALEDRGYRTGECSHAYASVCVSGRLEVVDDPAEALHALDVMVRQLEPDPGPVIGEQVAPFQSGRPLPCLVLRLTIDGRTGKHGKE